MLNVKRDDTKAVIDIETDLPFDSEGKKVSTFGFVFEMQSPSRAELLVCYIRNRLEREMVKVRHDAYEQGWRDAKSHRTKETWFADWL
jgi:hypothetical protein